MVSFVDSRRRSVSTLGATLCLGAALCVAAPASAAGSCVSAAQNGRGVPLADPRPYQPVNGTGGLSVFGANTVPGGGFSVGLGYLGTIVVLAVLMPLAVGRVVVVRVLRIEVGGDVVPP